ncbi:MAG: SpoIIIAH-like family protein [Clostridia bacterium]|nr:SpoIIIAH-like family protein [Oscillospiraceae bacterium]MBR4892461.1 SpoIIIAH-like family protein [Clostridia bacterium]
MMVIKKKQIVTVAMALLVVVAGYINFSSNNIKEELPVNSEVKTPEDINYGEAHFVSATEESKEEFFNMTKTNKDKTRSEAVAMIKEISDNENADSEAKRMAQEEMVKIAKNIEKEGNIENILMNKGFPKVSVYLSDNRVTVSVLKDGLQSEDIAKIKDTVMNETGCSADNITINEIK